MKVKLFAILALALAVTFALLNVPSSGKLAVVEVMPLRAGGDPASMAYDFGKGEIFLGSGQPYSSQGNIQVLCDANHSVVANIQLTFEQLNKGYGSLYGLAYDSRKDEIFASIATADSVAVISDTTNSVVATVKVGSVPMGIAYDAGKNLIFVANRGSNTVSVIADENNTVVRTIDVPENPVCLVYDSGKGEIFVSSYPSNVVSVISDETFSLVASIPVNVALGVQSMAYGSAKGEVFVVNLGTDKISVINDTTNAVCATVPLPSNTMTTGIAYDSNSGQILVGNIGPHSLSVISDSTNTAVQTVPLPTQPFQIVCDSGRNEILVSNSDGSVTILADSSHPQSPPSTTPDDDVQTTNSSSIDELNGTDNQPSDTNSGGILPTIIAVAGTGAFVMTVVAAVYVKKRGVPKMERIVPRVELKAWCSFFSLRIKNLGLCFHEKKSIGNTVNSCLGQLAFFLQYLSISPYMFP